MILKDKLGLLRNFQCQCPLDYTCDTHILWAFAHVCKVAQNWDFYCRQQLTLFLGETAAASERAKGERVKSNFQCGKLFSFTPMSTTAEAKKLSSEIKLWFIKHMRSIPQRNPHWWNFLHFFSLFLLIVIKIIHFMENWLCVVVSCCHRKTIFLELFKDEKCN